MHDSEAEIEEEIDEDLSYRSIETPTEDKILTESMPSLEDDNISRTDLDNGHIISPVKMDAFKMRLQLSGDISQVKNVKIDDEKVALSEPESDLDDYKRAIATPEK